MAFKYTNNQLADKGFKAAVLANANRGGENVATGALIGALMGAHCGFSGLPKELVQGLARTEIDMIHGEIDQFGASVPFAKL